MTLKELRKSKGLTQPESAAYLGVPLRTYQNYENDAKKASSIKYDYMFQKLEQFGRLDEEHGVLSIDRIRDVCTELLPAFGADYCLLFGSYAKGRETELSDVDLLISSNVTGLRFYEMVEALREGLNKKVDVLTPAQLENNHELVKEILKDGIRIYG